jgi:hypothetical protein
MTKLSKILIIYYVALLVIMFATPALAKETFTNTESGNTYCCDSPASVETCIASAFSQNEADFCVAPPFCEKDACPATTPTQPQAAAVAILKPNGETCNNSSECKSEYCSPDTGVCENPITLEPGQKPTPAGSSGGEPVKSIKLPNFLFTEDPNDVIGRVIEFVIGLAGTAALVMFIYGGVRWLTSGGNDEGIKKGREAMQWAAIGLIIVFSSYVLVKFVLQVIGSTAGA